MNWQHFLHGGKTNYDLVQLIGEDSTIHQFIQSKNHILSITQMIELRNLIVNQAIAANLLNRQIAQDRCSPHSFFGLVWIKALVEQTSVGKIIIIDGFN